MMHTPGPWHYQAGQVFTEWRQRQGASLFHLFICSVATTQHDGVEANGKLIAAAPDLLAACERALDALYSLFPRLEFSTEEELDVGDEHWIAEVILELRAAIAAVTPNSVPKGAHKATPPPRRNE
jgi:hypothetical protein